MDVSYFDLCRSVEADVNSQEKPPENNAASKPPPSNSKHMVEAKDEKKQTIFDKIKEIPGKANTISKKFQLWARQGKNLMFYRKYLDRIKSGLYERYAGQARVVENQMIDDPVTILTGPAQTYIRSIVSDINKLYQTVVQMSKSLETKMTAEQAIAVVAGYCKDALTQNINGSNVNQDKLSWKDKILNATKFKIAKILLSHRETGIYGYTSKNMVLKGFPRPNHLIVTLFVSNPEERPVEQSVTDIFKSADSFDILADSNKQDVFNVSNMVAAVMEKTVNNKVLNDIKTSKQMAIAKFKQTPMDNKKDEGKIIDSIWEGINASCKELLDKKVYLIDCINIYFDMILRIDKLAVKAINEMLDVENAARDKKYDSSLNVAHKRSKDNRYADDYDGDTRRRTADEKRQQYRNLNNTAKDLNRQMR